jgi:hypothetical protein
LGLTEGTILAAVGVALSTRAEQKHRSILGVGGLDAGSRAVLAVVAFGILIFGVVVSEVPHTAIDERQQETGEKGTIRANSGSRLTPSIDGLLMVSPVIRSRSKRRRVHGDALSSGSVEVVEELGGTGVPLGGGTDVEGLVVRIGAESAYAGMGSGDISEEWGERSGRVGQEIGKGIGDIMSELAVHDAVKKWEHLGVANISKERVRAGKTYRLLESRPKESLGAAWNGRA